MKINIANLRPLQSRTCNHCIGRLYGKFGHGITNKERGGRIRYALSQGVEELDTVDMKKLAVKEKKIDCWVCENLCTELDKFANLVIERTQPYEFNTFLIGSKIDKDIIKREEELWKRLNLHLAESIKSEFNREVGKRIEERINKKVDRRKPELLAIIDTRYDVVELEVRSLFLYGRYKKLIRGFPQTKLICKMCWGRGCDRCNYKGRFYSTSVEELIAHKVIEFTAGENHSLHGLGREYVEARMLGNGRPFVLEIKRPKRRELLPQKIEREINLYAKGKVEVTGIRLSSKEEIRKIKHVSANRRYRLHIEFEKEVGEEKIKEVAKSFGSRMIEQRTTSRVSHKRADKVRRRKILGIEVEKVERRSAWLTVSCEAGLYIKELVSGDEGRTRPSITEKFNVPCKLKELDVIGVEYG